jgi:lipid II:glycine glycyltransferase (peptidoglycan interpeptide bridge formation enzyme)
MSVLSSLDWQEFLSDYPDAHILQTAAWGALKSSFDWQAAWVAHQVCGAQVLFRQLPIGFTIAYIPKGPVGDRERWSQLWGEVDRLCKSKRAIHLIVEPDSWVDPRDPATNTPPPGFRHGIQTIQPARTIVIDLSGDESDLLSRMKQKTRYNVRLAEKRGVRVDVSQDIDLFYQLMLETGSRDQFGVHSLEYYHRAMDLFHPAGACELFIADYQEEPIAALMVFRHGNRAWYFYGASGDRRREHMPAYLLQWEAMRWARSYACQEYDLWGVPDLDLADLESQFMERGDGLWGVYRFKRGFGGDLRRSAGPWDRVYNPVMYAFYRYWVKRHKIDA